MKIKFNKNRVLNVIIITYVLFIIFSILAANYTPSPDHDSKFFGSSYIRSDTKLKPIDPPIPDSLQKSKILYDKLHDSLQLVRDIKNANILYRSCSYLGLLYLGTAGNIYCDTCSVNWFWKNENKSESNVKYGIKFLGWKLNAAKLDELYGNEYDSVQFHIEHGQAYLRKYDIISPPLKNKKDSIYYKFGIVDAPVKFNYDRRDDCIVIPVSKSVKNTMDVVFIIFDIMLIGYLLFLIGNFIGFIIDISKGLAFTNKNINTLRLIATTFLVYPVAAFLFNLLLRLILNSYFTSDVILNNHTWNESWKIIALGIIFLMLYKAFSQGKLLKDEQDLTV